MMHVYPVLGFKKIKATFEFSNVFHICIEIMDVFPVLKLQLCFLFFKTTFPDLGGSAYVTALGNIIKTIPGVKTTSYTFYGKKTIIQCYKAYFK